MAVKRVLLVRHGETDYNLTGRWQGHLQTPLNANGHKQADQLAVYMNGNSVDAIYSSDLPRTLETAQPLAQAKGMDIMRDARLREIHLGVLQGMTRDDMLQQYPTEYEAWRSGDMDYAIPAGESRVDVQQRAYAAWCEITQETSMSSVMIVTHGGTIHLLLKRLFDHYTRDGSISNTSITTILRGKCSWELQEIAATPHLID